MSSEKLAKLPETTSFESEEDYHRLRNLLLGQEYEALLKKRLNTTEADRVAGVISEAFHIRSQKDNSLVSEMSPLIESSIDVSIKNNPARITNVIYPVIGPAVRKAVTSALAEMVQSLNLLLQQSLTAKAFTWRFKAWRLGIPYSQYILIKNLQYRVEQAFLIHHETGLLIQSCSTDNITNKDPELVSAMLTAIADFIGDSFHSDSSAVESSQKSREQETLNAVRLGEFSLLIESGPLAVVAIAVRGTANQEITDRLMEISEKIHENFSLQLENFNGDTDSLEATRPLLSSVLIEKKNEPSPPSKPWLALIVIGALFFTTAFMGFNRWQQNQQVEQIIAIINQEPGYQLLNQSFSNGKLNITLLRAPSARTTKELNKVLPQFDFDLAFEEKFAAIDDPSLFLATLESRYRLDFTIDKQNGTRRLIATGTISPEILGELKKDLIVINLFDSLDTASVTLSENTSQNERDLEEFNQLVSTINNQYFYFEIASSTLNVKSQQHLIETITQLQRLLALQDSADLPVLQIIVSGHADNQGSDMFNQSLSEKRAQLVASIIKANHIKEDLIVVWGLGNIDNANIPPAQQRRVSLRVLVQQPMEHLGEI